jgi:hypothetical protein
MGHGFVGILHVSGVATTAGEGYAWLAGDRRAPGRAEAQLRRLHRSDAAGGAAQGAERLGRLERQEKAG